MTKETKKKKNMKQNTQECCEKCPYPFGCSCPCHTPEKEIGWEKEFDEKFFDGDCNEIAYVRMKNLDMDAVADVKSFISKIAHQEYLRGKKESHNTAEERKLKRLIRKGRKIFDERVYAIPYAGQMYEKLVTELYYKMRK